MSTSVSPMPTAMTPLQTLRLILRARGGLMVAVPKSTVRAAVQELERLESEVDRLTRAVVRMSGEQP
jgi:uncharacterized protein Yka (UPF0111/DUF47 family)